jgi:hypothetical protein
MKPVIHIDQSVGRRRLLILNRCRQSQLFSKLEHMVSRLRKTGGATFKGAIGTHNSLYAAANIVRSFQNKDILATPLEFPCSGKTGNPGADYYRQSLLLAHLPPLGDCFTPHRSNRN